MKRVAMIAQARAAAGTWGLVIGFNPKFRTAAERRACPH